MARGDRLILDRYEPIGTAGSGGFGTVAIAWDPRIQRKVAIKTIPLTELDAYRANLPGAQAGYSNAVREPRATYASPTADRWHGVMPWDEYLESEPDAPVEFGGYRAADLSPDDLEYYDAPGTAGGKGGDDAPDQVTSMSHLPGLDEARTAAMLSDPRIVTVYDFEIRDRMAYLIMEYVEGITLTRLLADYADFLTLDMVTSVFDAMAGALMTAHAAGVLHLDIKPDNIIINAQGQAKVTDFGLATLADASGAGTTGGGTIGYMPLEQMRREHLDARTDEWSLASVSYEMLTGENPFRVASLDQAEAAIEEAELVLPSLCWHGLDEQIDDVVFYALDPDPEERYASVKDFAEEMDKFLSDSAAGREQLSMVVNDALGFADHADGKGEDEPVMALERPSKKPGFLGRLFGGGSGGQPSVVRDDRVDEDDDDARYEEYDDDDDYDDYEEPPRARRSRVEKPRRQRTPEQARRLRAAVGRAIAALVGGIATWFALGALPAIPTLFGLDPLFLNAVIAVVVAAVCAIVPAVGLAIAAILVAAAVLFTHFGR